MSVWAAKWAYEQTVKPTGRKFVLVAIADFADENGWCFPSQETLAAMTDQGVSTVRVHLKSLETDGLLKREARYAKQGGGRKSDGFWLQAPSECLKPPPKSKPPKVGGKVKSVSKHSAETGATYRQVTGNLPPKVGDDPLRAVSEPKEVTPYAVLFDRHYKRIGKIPDAKAQGDAIKWILTAGHSSEKALACYESQLTESWRGGHVSWLTVKQRIGEFMPEGNSNGNGHDAAWHEKQAKLAEKLGRVYQRPTTT